MVQQHNQHLTTSLCISALAVTDTVGLLIGKSRTFPFIVNHRVLNIIGNCIRDTCLLFCQV